MTEHWKVSKYYDYAYFLAVCAFKIYHINVYLTYFKGVFKTDSNNFLMFLPLSVISHVIVKAGLWSLVSSTSFLTCGGSGENMGMACGAKFLAPASINHIYPCIWYFWWVITINFFCYLIRKNYNYLHLANWLEVVPPYWML